MGADNPGPSEGKDAPREAIGPTVFGTLDMENPPVTRPDEFTPHQRELYNRLGWFIQFRWIGLGGFCIGLLYTLCVLGSSRMLGVLFLLVAVACGYNLLFVFINHRLRRDARPSRGKIIAFALLQIFVDLIALSGIVHYTGGIDSVFVVCYVFHMVVAGVLLRPIAEPLPELKQHGIDVDGVYEAVRDAGRQLVADGAIDEATQGAVSRELIPPSVYRQEINAYFRQAIRDAQHN